MLTRRSMIGAMLNFSLPGIWKFRQIAPAIPGGKRVILVSAPWCPACKVIKGVIDELASHGQWKVGKAKDLPNIIIADPESPDGWEICKVLDCIGPDGMVLIPRLYVMRDSVKVATGAIYRNSPKKPWRIAGDERELTANNLADWINEKWLAK